MHLELEMNHFPLLIWYGINPKIHLIIILVYLYEMGGITCLSSSDLLSFIPITRNTFVDKESINPLPYLAFQTHSQKQA